MIPEITRRSSTRGTPRTLVGNNGWSRVNCSSESQKEGGIALPPNGADPITRGWLRIPPPFMSPEPSASYDPM